jgi:ferredoxin
MDNNHLLTWKSEGASFEGIPSVSELEKSPGYPGINRLMKGPVAVIECVEEIPCNPCQTACPAGAITIGASISNLPVLDENKCTGCGLCISSCPGLAIFVIDIQYGHDEALISLPFEALPLPQVGEEVPALNREGKEICQAKIVRISDKPSNGHTVVITISVLRKYALLVRNINAKPTKSIETYDNTNQMRISEHAILGRHKGRRIVEITVDNRKIQAEEGEMILAALLNAGIRINRYTNKYDQPRGFYCGIGQCTDCIMTVNGKPNVRTCVTPVEGGMVIETQYSQGKWE